MRRILPVILAVTFLAGAHPASGIDINPSKSTVPRSSWDTNSNHFSIFNGDPKRIQRANEVDPKSFDVSLTVTPNPVSLQTQLAIGPNPSIKLSFFVHNHGKKTYTLSFPTTQRWDFRVLSEDGTVVYTYSDTCEFLQTVGSSMVNHDDKLSYFENIQFDDIKPALHPGTYSVQAVVANYPEMGAETKFIVKP